MSQSPRGRAAAILTCGLAAGNSLRASSRSESRPQSALWPVRLRAPVRGTDCTFVFRVINHTSALPTYFVGVHMATEPGPSAVPSGNPPNLTDKLSAAATEGKPRAADQGRRAADSADQMRESGAGVLSGTSEAVKDGGGGGGTEQARRASRATAKALSRGADYVRDHSARDMMEDAMDLVKNNPGVALLGAVALGFLVGRAVSSRS